MRVGAGAPGISRLRDPDVTGQQLREPVRRYERAAPGGLVHVDVNKIGRIPDDGGWRPTPDRRQRRAVPPDPGPGRANRRARSCNDDRAGLAGFVVHRYNYLRPHTALKGKLPV